LRQALLLLPLALALALASLATAEDPASSARIQAPTPMSLSARPNLPRALDVSRRKHARSLASVQPVFAVPLQGPLESPFGPRGDGFHYGIDIGVSGSDEVHASLGGTVVVVGEAAGYEGYGRVVRIYHGRDLSTLYAHLANTAVDIGEHVARGEIIGRAGCTGDCTGPHLHFEVRYGETPIDPAHVLGLSIGALELPPLGG
jgi:murein DD-endopeptidase MepM/ murein hydrolase activator NlpD